MPNNKFNSSSPKNMVQGSHSKNGKYMLRALQIAKNGLGQAAPNPMVGCVIVNNGSIIGEGFTSAYGGPHAEVNAIKSVTDKTLLAASTLYVTLEPCSHFGKTPPCADLIVRSSIPNVVIGLKDPHDKVAGQGIAKLKKAGINVTLGVLENECREHHKRFLTFMERKRPYVILKWAESSDGFMAPKQTLRSSEPEPFWITNLYSRQLTHKWRSEEQAILVGTRTVMDDNPRLDTRLWKGKSPLRIVLDPQLKISKSCNVYDGSIPTLIFNEQKKEDIQSKNIFYKQILFQEDWPHVICTHLYDLNILSVLVEGGAKTLHAFLDSGLWDESRVFQGKTLFGEGLESPVFKIRPKTEENINGDLLKTYYND